MVDAKVQKHSQQAMAEAQNVQPYQAPQDDGHEETVEEVKAKMKQVTAAMNAGIAHVENRQAENAQEMSQMPDTSALTRITSTIHSMGMGQAQRQVNLLAARLGVQAMAGDEKLDPSTLSNTMIARAQAAGKTAEEIEEGLREVS